MDGQSISISITHTNGFGAKTTSLRAAAYRYRDTLIYTIPRDETLKKIEVVIDPGNQVSELDETNNKASLEIDWADAEGSSSYPVNRLPDLVSPTLNVFINGSIKENKSIVGTNSTIDLYLLDENPLAPQDTSSIEIYLKRCENCDQEKIPAQSLAIRPLSANQLHIKANLVLKPDTNYELVIVGKDAAGNRTQPPYMLTINTQQSNEPIVVKTYPNPATTYTKFEVTCSGENLPAEARLMIFNQRGNRILETIIPVLIGKNIFLWQGAQPGLYPYAIQLNWNDGRREIINGKVIWQP